jgi:hypothetical protein
VTDPSARAFPESAEKESALVGIRASIAGRVREMSSHMTEIDFDAMVDSMARVQLKYERTKR